MSDGYREELVNQTEERLVLEPGESIGVFMLSDPRPHPERNVVHLEKFGDREEDGG